MAVTPDRQVERNQGNAVDTNQRRLSSHESKESLDQSLVAEMNTALFDQMTCEELARVVRAADLPSRLCPDLESRLPYYDRTMLTRLAHLARQCCCNRQRKEEE